MHTQQITDPLQAEALAAERSGDPARIKAAYERLGRVRSSEARYVQIGGPEPGTQVVAGSRQTGKTYTLAQWIVEGRESGVARTMITLTEELASIYRDDYGLTKAEVVSWRVLQNHKGMYRGREFAIDETAAILAQMLGITTPRVVAVCTPNQFQHLYGGQKAAESRPETTTGPASGVRGTGS
jgi:hypothetical protein